MEKLSMSRTIIITNGTSANAQRVAKTYSDDHIVFADSLPVPKPFLDSGKFIQIPPVSSPHFLHELLKACLNQHADLLILQSPEEIKSVLPQKLLFEEYNIEIIC